MILKIFGYLLLTAISISVIGILTLYYVYHPVTTGTFYLANASGEAEIIRETDNGIVHVYADSMHMAVYA